jgi:hypothetical protein
VCIAVFGCKQPHPNLVMKGLGQVNANRLTSNHFITSSYSSGLVSHKRLRSQPLSEVRSPSHSVLIVDRSRRSCSDLVLAAQRDWIVAFRGNQTKRKRG